MVIYSRAYYNTEQQRFMWVMIFMTLVKHFILIMLIVTIVQSFPYWFGIG